MAFKITETITGCGNCRHYTNTDREHDDPFTCAPYPGWSWCRLLKEQNAWDSLIRDTSQIHKDCPLNKGS